MDILNTWQCRTVTQKYGVLLLREYCSPGADHERTPISHIPGCRRFSDQRIGRPGESVPSFPLRRHGRRTHCGCQGRHCDHNAESARDVECPHTRRFVSNLSSFQVADAAVDYDQFAKALREIDQRADVVVTIWQARGRFFCACARTIATVLYRSPNAACAAART